ncbi:MAG: hypothetical protein ACI9W2_002398 [Gammaproteobacteria bacterium]|jgi:hypothetical protein
MKNPLVLRCQRCRENHRLAHWLAKQLMIAHCDVAANPAIFDARFGPEVDYGEVSIVPNGV